MPDEPKKEPKPTATGGEPKESTAEPTAQPKAGGVDLDRAARKYRKEAETERKGREAAETKLKEFENQQKTEQEKLVEAAKKAGYDSGRKEADDDWGPRYAGALLTGEVNGRGLPESIVHAVRAEVDLSEHETMVGAVDDWMKRPENICSSVS